MGRYWEPNAESAYEDGAGGNAITESGVYIGKIAKCESRISASGAEGYNFEFVSNDGRVAKYLYINTIKKDGTINTIGRSQIDALCFLVNETNRMLEEEVGVDAGGAPVFGFPRLCNKPVGVILEREDKVNKDGKPAYDMRVRHWIDAATKKTYRETRGKMEAKAASQPIPAKKAPAAPLTSAQAQTRPVHPDSTANDDLPF